MITQPQQEEQSGISGRANAGGVQKNAHMSYVICPVSIVPVRNSSSNKSEMISQLLFGELAEVLETRGRQWTKVRCAWDNFVGWVASNQLKPVTPSEFQRFQREFAY